MRRPPPNAPASPAPRSGRGRGRAPSAAILHRSGGHGVDVVLVGGVGRAAAAAFSAPERGAPDVARDVVDGALVRAPERERGALRRDARGADAVLLLEAAQLLDELALGEVEGEAAADLLVEGARVVLVRRERGAPARREVEEAAQDEELLLVRPQPLEQTPRVVRGRTVRLRLRRRNCAGGLGGGSERVRVRWDRSCVGEG